MKSDYWAECFMMCVLFICILLFFVTVASCEKAKYQADIKIKRLEAEQNDDREWRRSTGTLPPK